MASSKQYRGVIGAVQFDPVEAEVSGQTVRKIVVRNSGFKEQAANVYVTLWPKHDAVAVEKGNVVLVEGSFTQGKGTNKNTGEPVTYNNLSATGIAVIGKLDPGVEVEVVNGDDTDDTADDDIPF